MVSMEELRSAATALDGKTLETLHQGRRFEITVTAKGLQYTPESTGKPRLQRWKFVERALERFNDINSFSPGRYLDISANAAYLLALISRLPR